MMPPPPRAIRSNRSVADQRGSGLLSTSFGVGIVVLLLFFASHLLLNLWLTSTVDDIATDAALRVARAGRNGPAVRADAEAAARAALGRLGATTTFEWTTDPEGRNVILRIRNRGLRLLPSMVADPLGDRGLDRRVVVRIEEPRP